MNKSSTQLEILLLLGTRFLFRESLYRSAPGTGNLLSGNEKLVEACWNGLINELLPEIFKADNDQEKLWLWQVKEAYAFLGLEWAQSNGTRDLYLSIDPYCFLPIQYYN